MVLSTWGIAFISVVLIGVIASIVCMGYAVRIAIRGFREKKEQTFIHAALVSLTGAIIPLGLYFSFKLIFHAFTGQTF